MARELTIAEVKEALPDVKVRIAGKRIVKGILSGRANPFATVWVGLAGESGYGPVHAEFAWGTVAHAVNTDSALIIV